MRAMSDFFYLPLSQQLFTLKKTELNEKKSNEIWLFFEQVRIVQSEKNVIKRDQHTKLGSLFPILLIF